jgi:hypothetical protein
MMLELDPTAAHAQVFSEFVLRDPPLWSVVGVAAHGGAMRSDPRRDLKELVWVISAGAGDDGVCREPILGGQGVVF